MKHNAALLRLLVLLAALVLIAGCSGIRAYPNTMKKNLFVDVKADYGIKVSLHVYKVDEDCSASYEGTVFAKKDRMEVGIPTGTPSYIRFAFASSSFFFGKSSTDYPILLTPRSGKVYTAKAIYEDEMYAVELREAGSARAKGSEVGYRNLDDCKPAK
jgi:hypothetical protein